ncbi:transmembrane protein 116-like isoform 1-T1 [Alca torda]
MQQGNPPLQPWPRGPSCAAAPRGWQGTGHRPLRCAQPPAKGSRAQLLREDAFFPWICPLCGDRRAPAARCCFGQGCPKPCVLLGQPRLPLRLLSVSLPQVFALTCIHLPASLLSLLGSGSVLAVTSRRRRCCHIQLRPLFLLALADFLAAAALLGTATIQLLPARLFIPAYAACPYGQMLATTFYAVSFLMVVVYAYEAYRTVQGWRAWRVAALQERSGCLESLWQGLPYILAWLVPALTLLGQLVARGTSTTDIAPRPIEPVVPWKGNRSHETYSLYCSSCLLLIRRAQDLCFQYVGRKDVGLEGKIIFFLYLLLVLSCCTLLYRRVKLRCRRNAAEPLLTLEKDGFAGRSIRSVSNVSHYFQLVFLLCWAPAFLLTLLSFTSIEPASVFVLYIATALTVPLQGFLHSLAYGWMRRNFRQEAVGERPSLRHPRGLKAFYDESLGAVP